MRFKGLVVGAVAMSLMAVGPGLAGASTSHKTTTTTHPKKKPKHPKLVATGVGVTHVVLNQDKQNEAVKLVSVVDPASPAQYVTPDPGTRFVEVEFQITNRSNGTDTGDANNNTSVVGTNKQVYMPSFFGLANCTDFDSGQYTINKGESEVGCVNFQVPNAVKVVDIKYNPNSGFSTNNAEWVLYPPA